MNSYEHSKWLRDLMLTAQTGDLQSKKNAAITLLNILVEGGTLNPIESRVLRELSRQLFLEVPERSVTSDSTASNLLDRGET